MKPQRPTRQGVGEKNVKARGVTWMYGLSRCSPDVLR